MRTAAAAALLGLACAASGATVSEKVLQTPSLVSFWDFQETNDDSKRSNLGCTPCACGRARAAGYAGDVAEQPA